MKFALKIHKIPHPAMSADVREMLVGLADEVRFGSKCNLYIIDYDKWLKLPQKVVDALYNFCSAMDKRRRNQYRWIRELNDKECDVDVAIEKQTAREPELNIPQLGTESKPEAITFMTSGEKNAPVLYQAHYCFDGYTSVYFLGDGCKVRELEMVASGHRSEIPQRFAPPVIPQKLKDELAKYDTPPITFSVEGLTLADFGIRKTYAKVGVNIEAIDNKQ